MTSEHPRRKAHRAWELEPEAERLRQRLEWGDMLAPFECCALWDREGLDPETLPNWVMAHLSRIAVECYRAGPDFENVTPREYRALPAKERKKHEPDLNQIAGLSGTRGHPSAWLWRAEHGRDPYLSAYCDHLAEKARTGEETLIDGQGCEIRILDGHGRVRSEALSEMARWFRLGGYEGGCWNKSRTARRRIKAVRRHLDK